MRKCNPAVVIRTTLVNLRLVVNHSFHVWEDETPNALLRI